MTIPRRIALFVASGAVVVVGLLCLNYTKASTLAHHEEWALERGLPAPGQGIFVIGVAAVAIGSAVAGFALARR